MVQDFVHPQYVLPFFPRLQRDADFGGLDAHHARGSMLLGGR